MKRFAAYSLVIGLATAGSAFAEQKNTQEDAKPQPVKMTDAQMDNISAGLITVLVHDAVDINQNDVRVAVPVQAQIPVNAAVAVLGDAGALQLGNLTQRQIRR